MTYLTSWTTGVRFPTGEIFLFPIKSRMALGSPSLLSTRHLGAVFVGLKRLGREADKSAPSNVKVMNGGVIPQFHISLYIVMLNLLSTGTILNLSAML
jgi:hypothetical protein